MLVWMLTSGRKLGVPASKRKEFLRLIPPLDGAERVESSLGDIGSSCSELKILKKFARVDVAWKRLDGKFQSILMIIDRYKLDQRNRLIQWRMGYAIKFDWHLLPN